MFYVTRKQSMAWMETDYSKHTHFRWKIKWRLEHLGALGIMDEKAFDTKIQSTVARQVTVERITDVLELRYGHLDLELSPVFYSGLPRGIASPFSLHISCQSIKIGCQSMKIGCQSMKTACQSMKTGCQSITNESYTEESLPS